jgi:cell cycle checkpoint control protein RAD9A
VTAVLKKPLHTSIAVEMDEFDDIEVPDKLHIIVSVKDFRNILQHAQLTSGELTASYSVPGRPMKLSYRGDGILCEYILMTVGERDAAGQRGVKRARGANQAKPAAARVELEAASTTSSNQANNTAPAGSRFPTGSAAAQAKTPARPRQSQFQIRPPPLPPASTLRSESLFVAQDEDQQWEPVNADEDADGEEIARLEWDNNQVSTSRRNSSLAANVHPRTRLQSVSSAMLRRQHPRRRILTRCSTLGLNRRKGCQRCGASGSSRRKKRTWGSLVWRSRSFCSSGGGVNR